MTLQELEALAQKIFDNSVEDNEINDFNEKINQDTYYVQSFFIQHLTPLLSKDVSNTLEALNNINKRIPKLIPTYMKYCFNYDFDYYYGEEDQKYELAHQFSKLIRLFLDNKFTTIQYVVDLLDNEKNKALNIYFANVLLNDISQIDSIPPQIVERIRNYSKITEKLLKDPEIIRDVAWPSVICGDTSNPRVSKFGGVQPFLPVDGYTCCHECHANCSMICQIYVPTTPQWFQDQFPPKYRDSLIVVLYCNTCYLYLEPRFYTSDQFDSLVYTNDIVYNGNYTFNEPRIVTGWTSGKMAPLSCNYPIMNKISSCYFDKTENFKESFSRFNYLHGPKGNNLTYIGGWPDFTQDDCTPSDSFFVINLSQSCSSTAMWGDAGTAQVWMKNPKGDYFGELVAEWACC